jgi:hypothetical protein
MGTKREKSQIRDRMGVIEKKKAGAEQTLDRWEWEWMEMKMREQT